MTIIYFILILGITVFIHELGHFMFAKNMEFMYMNFLLVWVLDYLNSIEKMMKRIIV